MYLISILKMDLKVLFSTRSYKLLANELLKSGLFSDGMVERKDFPDGEHYTRVLPPVDGKNIVLLGGTISDEDTLELYDLACGLVAAGAHRLWIIIPYYGYATMERAVKPGEIVTAKTRARLLSSIPVPGSGAQVILFELHVDSIAFYFEGNIRPTHLQGRDILLDMIKSVGHDEYVLASTDAGRAKQVQSLAEHCGVAASFIFNRRDPDTGTTEVLAVSTGDISGKHIIIYDDMIRTGGSLINAAKVYKESGAKCITVVSTHGVFAGDAVIKLRECGFIDKIIVTDSHPNARKEESDFITVVSIAPLLASFLSTN
jgi:ribose-phosphate pyrophosphokinase